MDWSPQAPLTALQAAAGAFFLLGMRLLKKVCFCHFFEKVDVGCKKVDIE